MVADVSLDRVGGRSLESGCEVWSDACVHLAVSNALPS
jgi:hypothetical protein